MFPIISPIYFPCMKSHNVKMFEMFIKFIPTLKSLMCFKGNKKHVSTCVQSSFLAKLQ